MSVKLGTTSRSGLSIEQVGGNDVYKMLSQIQSVLDDLGPEYGAIFAEPVDNGRAIDWYVEDDGKIESIAKLREEGRSEEANAGMSRLNEIVLGIHGRASELRNSKSATSRNYADILEKACTQPGAEREKYIFLVNGQPVLAGWGFTDGNSDLVQGITELLKKTADEIKNKQDSTPNVEPPPSKPADSVREDPPVAQEETPPSPENTQSNQGIDSSTNVTSSSSQNPAPNIHVSPASSMAWLPAALVGAGLLAAGAVAAWYFFLKNPVPETPVAKSDTSLGFLKGSLSANDVLVNEDGEKVNLQINFEGEDGIGEAVIVESGQKCSGPVKATLQPDDKVLFDIPSIECPNKNNYDALMLLCGRNDKKCIATDKDGATWNLDLK